MATQLNRAWARCAAITACVSAHSLAFAQVDSSTNAEAMKEIEEALRADQSPPPAEDTSPPAIPAAIQSLLPDIALISDFALAAFSEDENLQGGGHDPTVNGFNLQQVELNMQSKVDPYFRFDANIVFSLFGVEIEEAYATTLDLPFALQARIGQFLTRFGRINPTHPHAWELSDQVFAISRVFGSEGNRGLGAELSWLAPAPWYVELVASANMAGGEATARSFYGPDDLGVDSPLHFEWLGAIKQFFPLSDDLSLAIGLSGATGPNSTGRSNRSDIYGADIYLKYRPITEESTTIISLQTEWFYRRRQIPEDLLQDFNGYTQLFYRFARRWGVAARFELGTAAKNLAGEVGDDPLDPDWTKNRYRASASLTFWPTEFSRLRAQTSADFPRWRDQPIYSAFLTAELAIGAHGAHSF